MSTGPPPRVAAVLPHHWAQRLQRSSQTRGDFERLKAIEETTRQIKFYHPEYFKKEAL